MKSVATGAVLTALALSTLAVPGTASAQEAPRPGDLSATAQAYLAVAQSAIVRDAPAEPYAGLQLTDAMAAKADHDLQVVEERRETLAVLGERYSGARSSYELVKYQAEGATARVVLTERTQLDYVKIVGDEPDFTGYEIDHTLEFVRDDAGAWRLAVDSVEPGVAPITVVSFDPDQTEDPAPALVDSRDAVASVRVTRTSDFDCGFEGGCNSVDAVSAATKFPPSAITLDVGAARLPEIAKLSLPVGTQATDSNEMQAAAPAGMNYGAIVDYAYRHWSSYNTDYRSFPNDCTNFVSQALRSGGWDYDYGWYKSSSNWWYNGFHNQTFTWAGAENWSRFAPTRTSNYGSVYQMVPSDILQMDFDRNNNMNHTMIVTQKSGGIPFLTYHTNNTVDRSMRSLVASFPNALYYAYRT